MEPAFPSSTPSPAPVKPVGKKPPGLRRSRSISYEIRQPLDDEVVKDGLGHAEAREIRVDTLKWRFFELGLRSGIALQMLLMCVLLVFSGNDAIYELSGLYYPLFRGCFLLAFFGVLFGLLLFTWKRTGIDYAAILNVSPARTNYHAIVRVSSTLMLINFLAFTTWWLTCTVQLTPSKHAWPLAAFIGTLVLLAAPFDWQPEWEDAAQRAALVRTAGRALLAPFTSVTFASSFVADVFTSMPKAFIDLLYATCIYSSGEAFAVGRWHASSRTFDRGLTVCTPDHYAYKVAFIVLSMLPFYMRLMQCVRQIYDARKKSSHSWRQPLANAGKYSASLIVIALSIAGGRNDYWLAMSMLSTLFAFAWDVLVDWGLGPQPLRRAVRRYLDPHAPSGVDYTESASWWLRPVRVYHPSWYVAAIFTDLVARLGWAVYISPGQQVVAAHVTLLLGTVELLRRAVWALLRLEWEQILRVAKMEHEYDIIRASHNNLSSLEGGSNKGGDEGGDDERQKSLRRPLLIPPIVDHQKTKEQRIEAAIHDNVARMNSDVFNLHDLWSDVVGRQPSPPGAGPTFRPTAESPKGGSPRGGRSMAADSPSRHKWGPSWANDLPKSTDQ